MPALIRSLSIFLLLLSVGCSDTPGISNEAAPDFSPTEDMPRHEVSSISICIPEDFNNLSDPDQKNLALFSKPSEDTHIEVSVVKMHNSGAEDLEAYAEKQINLLKGNKFVLKEKGPYFKDLDEKKTLVYAADWKAMDARSAWSYWLLFAQHGADFVAIKIWTQHVRKIYFEEKANRILHSLQFLQRTALVAP